MKTNMSLRRAIATLLCIGISFSAFSSDHSHARHNTLSPLPGDYLRIDYLSALERTHSPLKAFQFGTNQLIKIAVDSLGLVVSAIENFHDGVPLFLLCKDGIISPAPDMKKIATSVKFKVIDSKHINLGFETFKPENYTYVGDAEQYVANKCLVGTYKNKEGVIYRFNKGGSAIFDSKKFSYGIGLDFTCSSTMNYYTSQSVDFAYELLSDTLKIYTVNGESLFEAGTIQQKPWLVLLKAQISTTPDDTVTTTK